MAALRDKKDIVSLQTVFEAKFDHNLRDTNGDTPLMLACRFANALGQSFSAFFGGVQFLPSGFDPRLMFRKFEKNGCIQFEARSRGRSSPDSPAF